MITIIVPKNDGDNKEGLNNKRLPKGTVQLIHGNIITTKDMDKKLYPEGYIFLLFRKGEKPTKVVKAKINCEDLFEDKKADNVLEIMPDDLDSLFSLLMYNNSLITSLASGGKISKEKLVKKVKQLVSNNYPLTQYLPPNPPSNNDKYLYLIQTLKNTPGSKPTAEAFISDFTSDPEFKKRLSKLVSPLAKDKKDLNDLVYFSEVIANNTSFVPHNRSMIKPIIAKFIPDIYDSLPSFKKKFISQLDDQLEKLRNDIYTSTKNYNTVVEEILKERNYDILKALFQIEGIDVKNLESTIDIFRQALDLRNKYNKLKPEELKNVLIREIYINPDVPLDDVNISKVGAFHQKLLAPYIIKEPTLIKADNIFNSEADILSALSELPEFLQEDFYRMLLSTKKAVPDKIAKLRYELQASNPYNIVSKQDIKKYKDKLKDLSSQDGDYIIVSKFLDLLNEDKLVQLLNELP